MNYLLGKSNIPNSILQAEEQNLSLVDYGIFPISIKRVPLLGEIACGEPIYASEDHDSYVMAGSDIRADFCLRAKGDSMINARIRDGDIVFIRGRKLIIYGYSEKP